MSEGAGFLPAKTFLQYHSPLLLSAGNAAKLLGYQSSVLRLWAEAAPGPWFQYQRSLLLFWARRLRASRAELRKWYRVLQHRNRTAKASSEKHRQRIGSR
jgi:hypothetical protein